MKVVDVDQVAVTSGGWLTRRAVLKPGPVVEGVLIMETAGVKGWGCLKGWLVDLASNTG